MRGQAAPNLRLDGVSPYRTASLGRDGVGGALAGGGVEDALAQAERFGRHLDVFVGAMYSIARSRVILSGASS